MASMEDGAWIVAVNGEDVQMELTFRGGQTYEAGLPVGTYEQVGSVFIATIGEDVRLTVVLGAEDKLPARLATKHGDQMLNEGATLFRADWN